MTYLRVPICLFVCLFQCMDEPQASTLPSVVILRSYVIRIIELKEATYSVLENTLLFLFVRMNFSQKFQSSQTPQFRNNQTNH